MTNICMHMAQFVITNVLLPLGWGHNAVLHESMSMEESLQ